MSVSHSQLGLSCPSRGTFYVCEHAAIRFIGCCTVDPCADGSGVCPQANLATSSFSSDHYDDIPPQSCAAPYNSSTWYTCKSSTPFMGCCRTVPCGEGCQQADLLPAMLSDDESQAQVFLSGTTASDNSSSSGAPSNNSERYSLSLGTILGISLGSAAVVAVILGFLMYRCGWWARQKKSQQEAEEASKHYSVSTSGQYSPGFPSPWPATSQLGSPQPSPGFPPYPANPYPHAQSGTIPPPESWPRDSRHVSELSGVSWDAVAAAAAQKPSTPLLSGAHAHAMELEGREMDHTSFAELPTSPTRNHIEPVRYEIRR
ncbi:hypothetical protein F4775DRAFT_534156 [Biscogniauxia sp. FL1348]|nr:hypothetical protein F4775DRAFT_534156 [Biscogniauxia sp. FL1348]